MTTQPAKVAFIGLGTMGFPMAGHLASKGHEVVVYNRTAHRAANWTQKYSGRAATTPAAAADGRDVVMMCVGNDTDVRGVVFGEQGVLAGINKGAILIDHTTASAGLARELETACKDKGVGFLDAPVSGGQMGAEKGILTIMVGGESATFDQAKSVLGSYARAVALMGPAGSGQLTKMVNQICIAGLLQGLSEGVNFGIKAGLDLKTVIDVVSKGAAGSWQMENRALTMAEDKFNFGFAVDWMRKDLHIALEEAGRNGARLPVIALIDQFYAHIQRRGGGRWDTSSLIHLLLHE